MASDDLRKRMQKAGVVGAPDVQYVEDARTLIAAQRTRSFGRSVGVFQAS